MSLPLPQGEGEDFGPTNAELCALLIDCATLWQIDARIAVCETGMEIATTTGTYLLQRAPRDMRPIRWLLHTPERRAANRPPRAAPSIGAALTALRNALGAETGNKLRIGATA
jgi:hypothetical protein